MHARLVNVEVQLVISSDGLEVVEDIPKDVGDNEDVPKDVGDQVAEGEDTDDAPEGRWVWHCVASSSTFTVLL